MVPSVRKLDAGAKALAEQIQELMAANSALSSEIRSLLEANRHLSETNQSLAGKVQELEHRFRGPAWTAAHAGSAGPHFVPPAFDQERRSVIDEFHRILYDSIDQSLRRSYCISWLGYEMLKWPTDLWVYHDIVVSMRPDVIVETGTHRGGSALFLATLCDLLQQGQVITIDIDETHKAFRPLHPRIAYLTGSSTDPAIVDQVRSMIAGRRNVIVILDADHNRDHVLAELRIYSELVPPNGYLIAEDTNINGHPAYPDFGPGPWEAVEQFLSENPDFVRDHSCERFLVSMNPSGFLRRKANTE